MIRSQINRKIKEREILVAEDGAVWKVDGITCILNVATEGKSKLLLKIII